MGTWMDQVTRGWLIYELTNSALHLGAWCAAFKRFRFLLLSPIAGSTADRYSRKFQVVSRAVRQWLFVRRNRGADFHRIDLAVACLRDGFLDGLRAGVSPTVARGDDLRLGAGEKSHQRHRPERRRVQYGAQHRPGPVGRADLAFRHRTFLRGAGSVFSSGHRVDAANALGALLSLRFAATAATGEILRPKHSSRAGNLAGARPRCAPVFSSSFSLRCS